ncbi:MAG: Tad domain-containing protein [Cellvibrionales bacterium]|nr:Tad domain-containing protein [Cellvibrionales bacterium]
MFKKQKGSVLPYAVALMISMGLLGQYVFNANKTANEATRLQNTTDAAAYSVATVYAQNLNFIALSNRSLVANQISMAQLVTIVSWTRMLVTMAETVNDIGQFIPYVNAVTRFIDKVAQVVSKGLERIAPWAARITAFYIEGTSRAQQVAVYGVGPLLISQEILSEVVKKNDPDVNYSFAQTQTLIGSAAHMTEIYGPSDCYGEAEKVRDKKRANQEAITRCRQFRNVTLVSRDGFTASRNYRFKFPLMPSKLYTPPTFSHGFALYSTVTIERGGETTMGGDTPAVEKKTPFTTWTAIDTISIHQSERYLDIDWPSISLKTSRHEEKVKLGVGHAYVGNECSRCHHITHEGSRAWKINPRGSACTDPDSKRGYGSGWKSKNDGAFKIIDVIALNCGRLSRDYGKPLYDGRGTGLTPFISLKQEGYVDKAGRIMLYLRKPQNDVETASETLSMKGKNKLDPTDGAQNNNFHGAAAATATFRRSNDSWMLRTTKRRDGRIEFGNAYNPLWQARLDKLTRTERLTLEGMKSI